MIEHLTPSELRVLGVVANDCLSDKDAALALGVTENTIRTHMKRCYEKLEVESRAQAAKIYRQHMGDQCPPLFVNQVFTGHAGGRLNWKVECDALAKSDWAALAAIIGPKLDFGEVEGVPRGGLAFAEALEPYSMPGSHILIVDDVLTTGKSMEDQRRGREPVRGLVLFARGPLPRWVRAVWSLGEWLR